eukprot:829069-Amphidinium_carterae.1
MPRLRSADRSKVEPYFDYLRWLLKAMSQSDASTKPLYRGSETQDNDMAQTHSDSCRLLHPDTKDNT